MKHRKPAIDGIIPRRQIGAEPSKRAGLDGIKGGRPAGRASASPLRTPQGSAGLSQPHNHRNTIEISEKELPKVLLEDGDGSGGSKKRGWRRFFHKPSKKTVKWTLIFIVAIVLAVAGYFGWKLYIAQKKIFQGGGSSAVLKGVDPTKLRGEGDGRINILLAGTSEDDPGHGGSTLTDSIMVASIDPFAKEAALVSIPRDLWVKISPCSQWYEAKINAVYHCGETDGFEQEGFPKGGMGLLSKVVTETLGIPIHYYAKVNYTAFREAVDAVGGIDITVESDDPRGIYDPNFDWQFGRNALKLPNGPVHLNGVQALLLARSRNAAGGYGTGNDFERTENQRKMLIALKDKATSAGTLTNPKRISDLIDAMSNNVLTDFSRDEIFALNNIVKDIDPSKIQSVGLTDGDQPLLTTGVSSDGQSIVRPVAGVYNFGPIQAHLRNLLRDGLLRQEDARIAVYNGTLIEGLATQKSEELRGFGYNVTVTSNAPTTDYTQTKIYDLTNGVKKYTREYLEKRFKLTIESGGLPANIPADADFVIIIGEDGVN